MAACDSKISEGIIDGEMQPATFDPPVSVYEPRLWPEGDRAFVTTFAMPTNPGKFEIYRRSPDGSWGNATLMRPDPLGEHLSTPSRGPDRRAVLITYAQAAMAWSFLELREEPGGWVEVRTSALGTIAYAARPQLSEDGLRVVFEGMQIGDPQRHIFYASRPSLDTTFGVPIALRTVPAAVSEPFLTADCGRIYFSALDTVLYLEQE